MEASEYITHSSEETFELGKKIGRSLREGSVIAFHGDLGAGKTTLIKGLVAAATSCSPHEVSSPTFVHLNIYEGSTTVYHFDLYRLKDHVDFLNMGFDEYLFTKEICCIEWAEKIEPLLPSSTLSISIKHHADNMRHITLSTSQKK